ncbi:MAG: DUF4332 domain-containing protein [Verrucomicrobiota bacterium]
MPTLDSIKGIKSDDRELLEAAGWVDPRQLAGANAKRIRDELVKANEVLNLSLTVPTEDSISKWITTSQELTGLARKPVEPAVVEEEAELEVEDAEAEEVEEVGEAVPSGPVNYEEDEDVLEMLRLAPLAIPIPNRILAEEGIPPSQISIAPVLNRAESDLDVRVTSKNPEKKKVSRSAHGPKGRHAGVVKVADSAANGRRALDTSRVRMMEPEEQEENNPKRSERQRQTRDERLNLLRTTREKTNRGREPGTRRYIRGVLHDRPLYVWFGCLVVILFQITMPLAIVSALLLVLADLAPTRLEWLPSWVIAFPLALPVLGLLYFTISFGVKCRVCGQKVLVHRHCRKNKKAHHVPGLGFVFPLAVQTLLFLWFNCTFCGTSIRIKE